MSMSGGSPRWQPSARAQHDKERENQRAGRKGALPGPGAYQPKFAPSTAEDLAGSTAFKSKSTRKTDETLKEVGDPGLYNPYANVSVSANTAKSFNKGQQSGQGNFGSKVKRAELSTPNDAPGPGTYDASDPRDVHVEAAQGSAFASQTKRGGYASGGFTSKDVTPGAGEYDPMKPAGDAIGGDSPFKCGEARFKSSVEEEQSSHVGPGTYSQGHYTISSVNGRSGSKLGAAFNSTDKREDRTRFGPATPGPGTYNAKAPYATDGAALAGSAAFKSKSTRKTDETLKEVGDPGLYNPYASTTIGASMSRSFNKGQQSGQGNFGTKVKRAELSTPNDAPGPGTYDASDPRDVHVEAAQGSAFASQTKRGGYARREVTPGVGEYTPVSLARERVSGGDSMFRSRDSRFKPSIEQAQSSHVGPGSYPQTFGTVASRSHKGRGKPSGWAASTSLRGDLWGT